MFGEGKTLVYFCKLARASKNLSRVAAEMLQAETHWVKGWSQGTRISAFFLNEIINDTWWYSDSSLCLCDNTSPTSFSESVETILGLEFRYSPIFLSIPCVYFAMERRQVNSFAYSSVEVVSLSSSCDLWPSVHMKERDFLPVHMDLTSRVFSSLSTLKSSLQPVCSSWCKNTNARTSFHAQELPGTKV